MKGRLFIISGPAGVGKGTIISRAISELPGLIYSVSCTTRAKREGEQEGKNYYYVTRDLFLEMIKDDKFLEWADVHGNMYGTRRDIVENNLMNNLDVLLEIDVQGAKQVKEKIAEAVLIFIEPPSLEELERRLRGRGTESEKELALRIKNARNELDEASSYDYRIVNDTVNNAAEKFIKIVREYREEKR